MNSWIEYRFFLSVPSRAEGIYHRTKCDSIERGCKKSEDRIKPIIARDILNRNRKSTRETAKKHNNKGNYVFYTTNKLRRSTYFCTPSGKCRQGSYLGGTRFVRSSSFFPNPSKEGVKKHPFFTPSHIKERSNVALKVPFAQQTGIRLILSLLRTEAYCFFRFLFPRHLPLYKFIIDEIITTNSSSVTPSASLCHPHQGNGGSCLHRYPLTYSYPKVFFFHLLNKTSVPRLQFTRIVCSAHMKRRL